VQKITIIKYLLHQKGGIEKRFQNYLEEFLKRGFEVSVLFGSEKKTYRRVTNVTYKRVNVGLVPSRNLRKIFFAGKVQKLLNSDEYRQQIKLSMGRTGKADIVIAAGNYPETKHDDIKASNWFKNPMYYLDRKSFTASGLILAASNQVKVELGNLFSIEDNRIQVLYPPVKSTDFYAMPSEVRVDVQKKYSADPKKTNFLFVSTGHKRKGLSFLLEIFSKLDPTQYELFVAGDDFDTDLKNVRCLGYQHNTNELYNMVDCLLHPASYEAFGQVVTESLLCGTPVMVSDRVGAKEIIKKGMGQVLNYNDHESWLNAVREIRKNDNFGEIGQISRELDIAAHIDNMLVNWTNFKS